MDKKLLFLSLVVLGILLIYFQFGLKKEKAKPLCPSFEKFKIGIPNPAAVYCGSLGYEYEVVKTEKGEIGYCKFPDGSKCEEWEFFAGKCANQWSYCERFLKGKIGKPKLCEYAKECATCILKDKVCFDFLLCQGKEVCFKK